MSSVTPLLPAALPDPAAARLPGVYEAAQKALAECSRIDECKTWADKAAALASYARQAKDDSLKVLAMRIQARAYRRMGELLKQIPPARGGDRGGPTGGRPPVGETRTQAANDAGLSEHQRKTALRVANVPQPEFEAATAEPVAPPTVTALAARGTDSCQVVVRDDIQPAPLDQATKAHSRLREFAAFCAVHDPARIALACRGYDLDSLRGYVDAIDAWLDRFVTHLPEPTE